MFLSDDLASYQRDYNILDNYTRQMASGLARLRNISMDEAVRVVSNVVDGNKPYRDELIVTHTQRQANGDRILSKRPILDYIDGVARSSLGMSPTMTTYLRPDQKKSLIVEDIAASMARRSIVKREGQLAKQAGDAVTDTIKNGGQNAIKRLINSWSGASLDRHNTFNCQSTHPTLTTMCRIPTALATATVEKFAAGMRYYHKPEKVIEDILYIIDTIDERQINTTIVEYGMYRPTVDDVMTIIKRSTDYYWKDASKFNDIRQLVETLTPEQRAAVAYDGDFYHMFIHNHELIHTFLTNLSRTEDLPYPDEFYFNQLDGDSTLLMSTLISKEIAGENFWDYLNKDKHPEDNWVKAKGNAIGYNIITTMQAHQSLLETFFKVKHYPLDVGAQNHAIRLTVPLGDTDSTIYTTKHISKLYFGEVSFEVYQEAVSDVMVYLINGMIAHALAQFTAQLGVVPESRRLLIMKSEFRFPSLSLTAVAKTYHAYVTQQEGLVFKKYQEEMKGARFHAGAGNIELVDELHTLMRNNLAGLYKGELIDRGKLIDIMLRVEEDITNSLHRKENVYFKRVRIKGEGEYTKPDSSVYALHTFWNEVFGREYDRAPEPSYMGYKVDLRFDNGVEEFLACLTPAQRRGIDIWRTKHNKKADVFPSYVVVPLDSFSKYGIPKVLTGFADVSRIVSFALDPHKLNLETMGIFLDKSDHGVMLHDIME